MKKRLFGLLTVVVMVFTACGTTSTSSSPSATSAAPSTAPSEAPSEAPSATPNEPSLTGSSYVPEPNPGAQGDTLIVTEWQTITTLVAYYSQANTDYEAATPALLGLVDISVDLKYIPELVEDVPLVSNGGVVVNGTKMDVTWKLRDGGLWSDGTPITCADIEATWKWIMDPAQTALTGGTVGWEDIESVEAKSDTECVVHFKNIYEGYIGLIAPLLPAHYLSTVPVADAHTDLYPLSDPSKGVYSGPFAPSAYAAGSQLEYVANPNFGTVSGGKTPNFKKLIFKYYPDNPDGMIADFPQGAYDVAMNLNHSDVPKLAGMDRVLTEDTFTYETLAFNNKRLGEKFGEDSVLPIKQAISLGVDKKQITDQVLGGTVSPMGSNNQSPAFWFYKDTGGGTYDVDAAKAALEAAGWVAGADGIREKAGKKLELDFCTTTRPYRIDSLTAYAAQLAPIGIKVNELPVPAQPDLFGAWDAEGVQADTMCNLVRGNYDVGQYAWVSGLDPLGSYNVYTCGGIPDAEPHNGQNTTRTCIPELDAAWNVVKSSVDFSAVRDAMGVVQDLYSKSVIELPLFLWKNAYLVNPKLHNVVGNPTLASVLWNVEDWYLEQ